VTITKNKANQYFASILVDDGQELPSPPPPLIRGDLGGIKAIGLDVGLTDFCITSDGSKYSNPQWLAKQEKNLKRKQQDLSRKQKGSQNRDKARLKVAKVHNRLSRSREDFQHKLSRKIVNENQVIVVENLNIRGMVRNHRLAKSISQVGWGSFMTMLKYKAEQEGKVYLEIDRFFPSSKTCHNCLNVVDNLSLDLRQWTCNNCGSNHDRDINAAINIREEGLRLLITSGTGDKAYCPDVRRDSRGRKKSTITLSVG
jgi:putative transposase